MAAASSFPASRLARLPFPFQLSRLHPIFFFLSSHLPIFHRASSPPSSSNHHRLACLHRHARILVRPIPPDAPLVLIRPSPPKLVSTTIVRPLNALVRAASPTLLPSTTLYHQLTSLFLTGTRFSLSSPCFPSFSLRRLRSCSTFLRPFALRRCHRFSRQSGAAPRSLQSLSHSPRPASQGFSPSRKHARPAVADSLGIERAQYKKETATFR